MRRIRRLLRVMAVITVTGVLLILVVAVVGAAMFGGFAHTRPPADLKKWIPPKAKYQVEILRDEFGVPHVFGKTDADCAYGLAWAECEDDFKTMYQVVHLGRGRMALLEGRSAAPIDFMVKLLRVEEIVNRKYDSDLAPETRALCEAFAEGCNHFAATHPEQVTYWDAFPITGKDIVLGFVVKTPMFAGIDRELRFLLNDVNARNVGGLVRLAKYSDGFLPSSDCDIGSNTFAVSPSKSADGSTFLDVNSHQPYTGPVSWYEAHIKSEQGLDVVGGVFPGSPIILHGHNRNLGWAMTVNSPDILDVYELKLNPRNLNQYLFDGKWRDFETYNYDLKVRLWRSFTWTLKLKGFESVHGPAIKLGRKAYAIRYANHDDIRMVEEWYRMNKATDMGAFVAALKMRAIPSLNIGYADKAGNIMYLYNASIPVRAEGYDWKKPVPGDTSATLWTEMLPFSKLPMVVNPKSGFVQNCNGTPFKTTIGDENPKASDYSKTCGIETTMLNRGLRLLELLGRDNAISYEDFYDIKYDIKYSRQSRVAEMLDKLLKNPPHPDDPLVKEGIALLKSFNYTADLDNRAMPLAVLTVLPPIAAELMGTRSPSVSETFERGLHVLHDGFGRLDVPWRDVNMLMRGKKKWPLQGGPDTLRCVYGLWEEAAKCFKAMAGDTYVLLVRWDKAGNVSSESIHQFGSATQDERSPHYDDQSPLFARQEMKPTWFDEKELLKHLESRYHPSEARPVGKPGQLSADLMRRLIPEIKDKLP
jgi:acyl-homoserine-lactone acylase